MPTETFHSARRAIARQVRDALPPMGTHLIRNRETGQALVASNRNVHGAINRSRFELRLGSHPDRALQAQWDRSGPEQCEFEVLELLQEKEGSNADYAQELRLCEELYRERYAPLHRALRWTWRHW